jgi:O-antigen ligase
VSPRVSILLSRMYSPTAGPRGPMQLVVAAAMSLLCGYAVVNVNDWFVIAAVFGAAGFAVLGVARPAMFLGLLLLVRPLLDDLGAKHDVSGINAAGLLGLLIVFLTGVQVMSSDRQFRPRATAAFGMVLVISLLACLPAFLDYSGTIGGKPFAEFVRLAAIFGVYVLAAQLFTSPRRIQNLFAVVGLSGVVPAFMGIQELITGTAKASGLNISRISGPFTGPNPFGLYLALTALVLISLPRRALPLWVRLVALAPILVALVGTYSRAGWALFLIGFVPLVWQRKPAMVGLGLVAVLSLILFVPTIHDRVLPPPNAKDAPTGGGVTTPESYQFRLDNWRGLLGKWVDRPLTGYGLATTPYVNPRQGGAALSPTGATSGYDAHNSAIKLLVEGGVVMLVAWIALIAIIASRMRALSRREWPFRAQARSLFVIWVGTIVIGLGTDDPLAGTAFMYSLFALCGALEGAYYVFARRSANTVANASAPEQSISL